ncbi:MAG: carboxypeptidase M32 [Planctomycetes bacterium]|jgi:carboxypeptidase Taq|nr:carboxypeptidase M32 [Planctomycetota bacterium]MDP6410539.1 carboxypeptidase M32 [Planctomycetota bacterium]
MSDPHGAAADTLFTLWAEIEDLDTVCAVLEWDQQTYMPAKGQAARGGVLATIAGLKHSKLTAPALSDALEEALEEAPAGSVLAAQVREARRRVERALRIPAELAKRTAEAKSAGLNAWQAAREASDFSVFQPRLQTLVELKREIAGLLAPLVASGKPFDAMLDEYERGSNEETVTPLLAALRDELSPLVTAVAESGIEIDESAAGGRFEADAQLAFGRHVAEHMGFDLDAGRIDAAPHPFCSGFHSSDVRLTWRWSDDDFRPALFGIMHEAGHGLYEQGLPDDWLRTPLGHAISLGVHESQSRLWENQVGRSRAFWEWALPEFRRTFHGANARTVDELYPALHATRPSTIRVEADEVSYNLHIVVRYELERALFSGELAVPDLPDAWNERYEAVLGLRPADDAEGVLQDIHWSCGVFGYFPTYAVGNLLSAQLFESAREALGDLDRMFAAGEFHPLLEWMRGNIHRHGRLYSPSELVERATGRPLSTEPFMAHIRATIEDVYGFTP